MVFLVCLLFLIMFSLSCIPFLLARIVFSSRGIFYNIFAITVQHLLYLVFFISSLHDFSVSTLYSFMHFLVGGKSFLPVLLLFLTFLYIFLMLLFPTIGISIVRVFVTMILLMHFLRYFLYSVAPSCMLVVFS